MKPIHSETKRKIIEITAPYVPVKEIEANFGLNSQTVYHYCNTRDIPKHCSSKAKRRKEAIEVAIDRFETVEEQLKRESIQEAKRLLNGSS